MTATWYNDSRQNHTQMDGFAGGGKPGRYEIQGPAETLRPVERPDRAPLFRGDSEGADGSPGGRRM